MLQAAEGDCHHDHLSKKKNYSIRNQQRKVEIEQFETVDLVAYLPDLPDGLEGAKSNFP